MDTIKINFDQEQDFDPKNWSKLAGICGLYFISLPSSYLAYPYKSSRLIYIGMSEKKTNSIGKRLSEHFDGTSGNKGLLNYRRHHKLRFTYFDFEIVRQFWPLKIEDLETHFIESFINFAGIYPVCNNKTGPIRFDSEEHHFLSIDWQHFA